MVNKYLRNNIEMYSNNCLLNNKLVLEMVFIEIYCNKIIIKHVWSTVDAQFIIRELTSLLQSRGYRVNVYFTGEPVSGSELSGLFIELILDKELDKSDYLLIKKILST